MFKTDVGTYNTVLYKNIFIENKKKDKKQKQTKKKKKKKKGRKHEHPKDVC